MHFRGFACSHIKNDAEAYKNSGLYDGPFFLYINCRETRMPFVHVRFPFQVRKQVMVSKNENAYNGPTQVILALKWNDQWKTYITSSMELRKTRANTMYLKWKVRECYDKHGYNLRVQVSNALSWNDQIKFVIIFCAIRQRKGDSPRGMSFSEPYYMVEKREKLV